MGLALNEFSKIMKNKLNYLFAGGCEVALNAESLPEWIQLVPTGEFPTRDKKHVQVFNAESFAQIVQWFDFWPRRIGRLMGINACPVWVGHPDYDPQTWPERKQIGHVAELEARDDGLYGKVVWNAAASEALRKDGHKWPSVAVDCETGDGNQLTPVMLMSVGMWHKPNIKSVQAVINAVAYDEEVLEDQEQTELNTERETMMLTKIMAALMEAGLIKEGDSEDAVMGAVGSLVASLAYRRDEEARREKYRSSLNAAEGEEIEAAIERVTTELNAANDRANGLAVTVSELRSALHETEINAAIETGRVTAAEAEDFRIELNAEGADGAAVLGRLRNLRPKLNAQSIGNLGGQKLAIASAAQRTTTLNTWCESYMAKNGCDYDAAWNASKLDEAMAAVHAASAN